MIRIGCSGYTYRHWRDGVFYPPGLRGRDEFRFYTNHFDTVELNYPHYRHPNDSTIHRWRDESPVNFEFTWKASQYITHYRRLRNCEESLPRMLRGARLLGEKLGPILFQLGPQVAADLDALKAFIRMLPWTINYAFEFRHPSWLRDDVYSELSEKNAPLVWHDHLNAPIHDVETADWFYVRCHGPSGAYWGSYSDEELSALASKLRGRNGYVYFNNDHEGHAPRNALQLRRYFNQ